MDSQDHNENEKEKTVKRFTSYKEFVKEFYPKQERQEAQQAAETNGDFGAELAIDSLNKHAGLLRFGDV